MTNHFRHADPREPAVFADPLVAVANSIPRLRSALGLWALKFRW